MAGPEITFLFQFGNWRDIVTVDASTLNLKTLKDLACDFINTKVRNLLEFFFTSNKYPSETLEIFFGKNVIRDYVITIYLTGSREWCKPFG